jgi:glycerol uptake facilitator-like aquaporin
VDADEQDGGGGSGGHLFFLYRLRPEVIEALAGQFALLGPVSGAHFNPVVTLAEWWTARRGGTGVNAREVAVYVPSQIAGAIAGAILADAMFGEPLVKWSTHTVPPGTCCWERSWRPPGWSC